MVPGFEDYTVGVETSLAKGSAQESAKREVVARVTTKTKLDSRDRETAKRLISLNVPELDRVEFITE